jgi:hypothetical protein
VLFAVDGKFPGKSFFTGLDVFADLLNIEPERKEGFGHESTEKFKQKEL